MNSRVDLGQRANEPEIMDDLNCSGEVVYQTLRELDVINRWLGGNAVTLGGLKRMIRLNDTVHSPISIADLGCGSGDLLRQMAEFGRRTKIPLQLVGIDANPHIIEFARQHCAGYPEISFETVNVLSPEFAQRTFDIITGTLFFHHFENDALVRLLAQLNQQARQGILINDIHRHWLAYHSIRLLTKLFSSSSMVRYDAPLSVRRAFTRKDWGEVMTSSGIANYRISWKWAFRWQITVAPPGSRLAQFW